MASARARAIAGLGGCCRWCGSPHDLEIDHIHGGQGEGNAHRAALGTDKLETWLCREFRRLGVWPAGYQLLCHRCHLKRHGKGKRMPAKEGNVPLTTSLSKEASALLATLATRPEYGSKGRVLEAGLHALSEGQTESALVDSLHQHLASGLDTLRQDMQTLLDKHTTQVEPLAKLLQALHQTVGTLGSRMEALERAQASLRTELVHAYDQLRATPQRGFWGVKSRT
jgi:hypothetical protein